MKLKKKILAKTFALATAIFWLLCSAFVLLFPDLSMSITGWWMHGMNISVMGNWNLNFTNFLLGGITMTASAWVSGYIFGWSWETMSKG
jgi:hypothetical protein